MANPFDIAADQLDQAGDDRFQGSIRSPSPFDEAADALDNYTQVRRPDPLKGFRVEDTPEIISRYTPEGVKVLARTGLEVAKPVGQMFGYAGNVVRAIPADAAALYAGPESNPEAQGNLSTAIQQPLVSLDNKTPPDRTLPIDTTIQDAREQAEGGGKFPLAATVADVSQGIAKTAPKLAVLPLAGEGLAAQAFASGGLFGLDDNGKFSPKEAVIMGLLPGVGTAARRATGLALSEAVRLGAPIENKLAQKVVEEIGHQAGLNAYMAATELPELAMMTPEERRKAVANIVGTNLAFGLLGVKNWRAELPSETRRWIEERSDEFAKPVLQRIAADELSNNLRGQPRPDIQDNRVQRVSPFALAAKQLDEVPKTGTAAPAEANPFDAAETVMAGQPVTPPAQPEIIAAPAEAGKPRLVEQQLTDLKSLVANLEATIKGNQLSPESPGSQLPEQSGSQIPTSAGHATPPADVASPGEAKPDLAETPKPETLPPEPNAPQTETSGDVGARGVVPAEMGGAAARPVDPASLKPAHASQLFDDLVKDYGVQSGWATGDEGVYDRSLQTANNPGSAVPARIESTKQMARMRRAAESDLVPQAERWQTEHPAGRAALLPKLVEHLRRQFPGDKTVDEKLALAEFKGRESAPVNAPERSRRQAEDERIVQRIVQENPRTPELVGITSVGGGDTARRPQGGGATAEAGGNRRSNLSEAARNELERVFGVRIIPVQAPEGHRFNGYKDARSNTILLDANSDIPALAIAGHEISHHIERTHPVLYTEMMDALMPLMKDVEAYRKRLANRVERTDEATTMRELAGDFLGDNFNRPEFWNQLASKTPEVFRRLARVVKNWLDKVLGKAPAKGYGVEGQFADLDKARQVVAEAVARYGRERVTGGEPKQANVEPQRRGDAEVGQGMSRKEEGGDLFGAPESVAERAARPLTGADVDTTREMFGAEVRQDKSGQGSLFSRKEENPLWRDNILDALGSWQNKGTAEQLRAHLAKTKGAMDEAAWIGLDDFLKDKPNVTKQEVADFVRQNQVQVQEVENGGQRKLQDEFRAKYGSAWSGADLTPEELERWKRSGGQETKFSQYQLPGGENYRELLLTLPEKDSLDRSKTNFTGSSTANFRSSHFDEPNVLAHVRFNERTDAEGKKVLFVEEVQSDWHQKGRKEGYQTAEQLSKESAEKLGYSVYRTKSNLGKEAYFLDGPGTNALGYDTASEAWSKVFGLIKERRSQNAVPDAPFKQTWPMLAMKRMIRYAAEHGFDRLAWTTGEQQAARYDLSKHVREIRLTKSGIGGPMELVAVTHDGNPGITKMVHENQIADYIGKEAAEKLENQEWSQDQNLRTKYGLQGNQSIKVLKGLDLKVGGEGMKGFYDKILPGEVNKFVKKWGGRVGQTDIGSGFGEAENIHGESPRGWGSIEADKIPPVEIVHSLDITPAMRDAAMEGVPLFSRKEHDDLQGELSAAEEQLKEAIRLAGNPERAGSKAEAEQAKALATARVRELQRELAQHPARYAGLSVDELNAKADEVTRQLAENKQKIAGMELRSDVYEAAGSAPEELLQLRSENYQLLKDSAAIQKELLQRPERVAALLKRADALTKEMRQAQADENKTAARHAVDELMALNESEFARIDPALLDRVRKELEAKGEIEPQTAATKGRTLGDLTDWLKGKKLDSPKLTLRERLDLSKRLGDEFAAGKTLATKGWARMRAMWEAFKAQWKEPKRDDSVRSVQKEWGYEKQFSGLETHQWLQQIKHDVPKKLRRGAISVWLDAEGDKGLLKFQRDAVPDKYRPVWDAALKLTPDEQALALRIKQDFNQKLLDGQLLGLIDKGRAKYGVPQVWDVAPKHGENWTPGESNKKPRNPLAKLDPRDPFFALQRTHDSYFDGIMAGGVPKSLDIADLVGIYNVDFHGALADRSMIRALKDAQMPDGSPAVKVSGGAKIEMLPSGARVQFVDSKWRPQDAVTPDGRPYENVDHWALRGWKFAAKDTAGNPIMVHGDFLVHPDFAAQLRTMLEGKSALRDPKGPLGDIAHLTNAMLNSGAFLKASKFASATFHGATLAEHLMTHAFSGVPSKERLGLLNPWVGGVEVNPAKNLELANLMRHGMDLGFGRQQGLFEEGLSSHGGIWAKVPGLGTGMSWLSEAMFKDYLPRLKVKLGQVVLHANQARYADKLTQQQIYELTANQVNAAFGGQNWALLGRSKTFMDVNRLFFTAPDFLLSRAKVVGQALKPYGREQRLFLLAQTAIVYGLSRVLNQLLDDDPHWEPENALRVIHKGRAYSARFIVNDMMHAATDPAGFASGRLGPWPRTAYETVTGRDMRTGSRKDVPIDTENPIFRSAQIAVKDMAEWMIPVGTEGLLPGATGREQTGLGQLAVGALGVGSQRYTPETEMYDLAAKFNRNSPDPKAQLHQKERDDGAKQASAFRKLDVLLEAEDWPAARKEYQALIGEGHTAAGIEQRYRATTQAGTVARPFSGSAAREKDFKASLTPEQRAEYDRAIQLRRTREKAYRRMLTAGSRGAD